MKIWKKRESGTTPRTLPITDWKGREKSKMCVKKWNSETEEPRSQVVLESEGNKHIKGIQQCTVSELLDD